MKFEFTEYEFEDVNGAVPVLHVEKSVLDAGATAGFAVEQLIAVDAFAASTETIVKSGSKSETLIHLRRRDELLARNQVVNDDSKRCKTGIATSRLDPNLITPRVTHHVARA